MSKQPRYFSIGVFTLAAFLIALTAVIFLGGQLFRNNTQEFLVTFKQSVNGLKNGSKVKLNGIEIGSVKEVFLYTDIPNGQVYAPTIIEIDLDALAYSEGRAVSKDAIVAFIKQDIQKGLVANLKPESLLTGILYIELNFASADKERFILQSERFEDYAMIPSVDAGMEELKNNLQTIMENLSKTDVRGLIDELKLTVTDLRTQLDGFGPLTEDLSTLTQHVNAFVSNGSFGEAVTGLGDTLNSLREISEKFNNASSPLFSSFQQTLDQLNDTLNELKGLSRNAGRFIDPSSKFYMELQAALVNFSDTARSLSELTDYLQRNPNALLTGRPTEPSEN